MFCHPCKTSNVETAKNLGIALTVMSLITCLGGNLQTNEGTVYILLFRSSHFSSLVFGHFCQRSYKNMKILHNLCLHFARQDGQGVKNGKKIKQLK